MKSIQFNTGIWREYAVNGDENNTVRVNLSDVNLVKRLDEVDAEAKEIFARLKTDHGKDAMLAEDANLRSLLDRIFGGGFSGKVFGETNVLSPTDDGCLFTSFCEAFGKLLQEDAEALRAERRAQKPEISPAVQKYLPEGAAVLAQPLGVKLPDVSGLTADQKKALLRELLT